MNEEDQFLSEVNSYLINFKAQDVKKESLSVSFAVALIIMKKHNLIPMFTEVLTYYNNHTEKDLIIKL